VFSTPGSPSLAGIMAELQRRGWSASLYLKGLAAAPARHRPRLRELFLLPAARSAGRLPESAGRRERELLFGALERDLAAYRGPGFKVSDAAAI
jgi:hypothetical protein